MNRLIVSRLCALYIHHMFIIIFFVGPYEYFVRAAHTGDAILFWWCADGVSNRRERFSPCARVCVSSKWTFSQFFLLCAEWGQTTPFCLWRLKEALNRFVTKPPIGRAIQVADVRDEWPVWRFFFGLLLTHARAHTDLIDSDHLHRSSNLHCSAVLVANKAPSTKLMEPIFFKGFATSKNLRTGRRL